MNIFVTGTDTDIGKTVTSAWICRNSKAKYWKPIQTGEDSDAETVRKFSPKTEIIPNAYRLVAPLSAYDSARLEGVQVDISKIIQSCPKEKTVIEGAGGALVPITENTSMADLIKPLNAKALIVTKSQLGFLNHIFLTVEALRSRSVEVLGIILNGKTDLIATIEKFSKCKVLASLQSLGDIETFQLPDEILKELR